VCQLPNLGENTYLQVRKLRSGTPQLATRRRVFTWLYEDEIRSVEGPDARRGGTRRNRPHWLVVRLLIVERHGPSRLGRANEGLTPRAGAL